MTPESLNQRLERLFGRKGLTRRAGKALRLNQRTIRKYLSGETAVIPGPVESAIELAEICPSEILPRTWKENL